jgi:hypothetical protein
MAYVVTEARTFAANFAHLGHDVTPSII